MWKRPESELPTTPETIPQKLSTPFDAPRESRGGERPTIGSKTSFKGDLSGEEDLIVEGRVEGRIEIRANTVTIGRTGWIKGNVYANIINIEGELIGDAFAGEKVNVYKCGNVRGNITAPRVSLEDGAKLKGIIDMEPSATAAAQSVPNAVTNVQKATESVANLQNAKNGNSSAKKSEEPSTGDAWR